MVPAYKILSKNNLSDTEKLWRAADALIEYRTQLNEYDGEEHYDINNAAHFVQTAAIASHNSSVIGVSDALTSASKSTNDDKVIGDIYRLMVELGYDCPSHGKETFEIQTGCWHFNGEPWDNIEIHEFCAYCGEEVILSNRPINLEPSEELNF